ncbi:MAG: aldo/keto reductase, partial [Holophagales bacterium]|nr:aldo/keto reductase [Holophagales bacterium]
MKTLPIGRGMPALGLGTWKSEPGEVGRAVEEAIRLGYRHLDCAYIYGNESEIGEALERCFESGLVERQELWVTSKLWNDSHHPDRVGGALGKTFADLRLDFLDLYLIHWPVAQRHGTLLPESGDDFVPLSELPIAATWKVLEAEVERGRC